MIFLDEFNLQCRIVNKPYDVFGTWYSENYLLSGNIFCLGYLITCSILKLNKASQETSSEYIPIISHLFKFYNKNASSIRGILVANCFKRDDDKNNLQNSEISHILMDFKDGSPVYQNDDNHDVHLENNNVKIKELDKSLQM